MRIVSLIIAGCVGVFMSADRVAGQALSLDSLLIEHSHEMSIASGRLTGPGLDVIMEAAGRAQFVGIAEEHNVRELNEMTGLLFEALHLTHGFRYAAFEQGSVITSWIGSTDYRGDIDAVAGLVGRYPHAPTFATDEELQMMVDIGRISSAKVNPVWGIDQELGALHILERLAEIAPDDNVRSRVMKMAAEARKYEDTRSGDTHYLAEVATPEDFSDLPSLFNAIDGSEANVLIEALQRTARIYHNFALSRKGQPTGYENGREREESMKHRFMEQYRRAQAAGDTLPRVVARLGHWHMYRGIFRANVPTFGNFLSEFAVSNGMNSFILAVFVVESPEAWRNIKGPLAAIPGRAPFTVVDFRPLRPLAHQKMIADMDENFRIRLYRADAALIIRGGRTGAYTMTR